MIKTRLYQIRLLMMLSAGLLTSLSPAATFQRVYEQYRFEQPVYLTSAVTTVERLYVVQQGGRILSFPADQQASGLSEFYDHEQVSQNRLATGGEKGLLGLAFDPDFANNGHFYVNYTAAKTKDKPLRTVVSRFTAAISGVPKALPGSETVLLEIEQDFGNHNGGTVLFGPDGKLYIGMGDGGSAGDPRRRAQDGQSLLGKVLRLNPDGSVPADNPFVDQDGIRSEIWAVGLRNPWRMSFDRDTGDLWAADVGQNRFEEINRIERAGNYGWPRFEGRQTYASDAELAYQPVTPPVHQYSHDLGQSVSGGNVYRGSEAPQWQGWYLFADFLSSQVWALDTKSTEVVALQKLKNPVAFGEDRHGELYVLGYGGELWQLVDR